MSLSIKKPPPIEPARSVLPPFAVAAANSGREPAPSRWAFASASRLIASLRRCAIASILLLVPAGIVHSDETGPGGSSPAESPPRIVTTFYPLQIIALNVTQGLGEPELLLEPSGGCTHGLALRPSQVRALHRAEFILETGLGLEPFLDTGRLPLAEGALRIPAAQLIADTDLIPLAGNHHHATQPTDVHGHRTHDHTDDATHDKHEGHGEPADHAAHDHEPESATASPLLRWDIREGFNGHAWSSPRLAGRMAQALGEGLAEADPPRAAQYRAQADAYAAELYRLADDLDAAAAPLAGRRVVLSHTSLAYLARDLGLEVVATLRDEDENEPTPRGLARLIDKLRADGVDAILFDPQGAGRLEHLVAAEAGVGRVIELNPASAGPLEPAAYFSTMRRNLDAIAQWAGRSATTSRVAKQTSSSVSPLADAGAAKQ